jgi:hypothetical protein
MTPDEGRDEDLVFQIQPGQLGKLELAFNHDRLAGQPDPFHDDRLPLGELR